MNLSHDPIIRPAEPKDASAIIPLIHASGPVAWDYVFTEKNFSSFDFLNFVYVRSGNTVSYSNHWVALVKGEVVGCILSYTQPKFNLLTLGTAFCILRKYKFSAIRVILRGLHVETLIRPPKSRLLYLGHISVLESMRGKGIATQLMETLIQKYPQYKTIALDVSQKNPSAISLYTKMGFVVKESRELKRNPANVPPHFYMEKQMY